MRRILAIAMSVLSLVASATEMIETPGFRLRLEGDWKSVPGDDPEQRSVYSRSRDVGVTLSYMLLNATPADTQKIAQRLKDSRLKGEQKAASEFNLRMTIVEPIVVPFSKGHQVAYYGHDDSGRQFRYLGLVFANKMVNIYAESKSRSQADLEMDFNTLLKGFVP